MRPGRGRRAWTAARVLVVAVVLAVLVGQLGAEPFLDGVRGLDAAALLGATALGAGTTVCAAWRWQAVARALGLELALPAATAASYRAQFLNSTLPGGVLGDVERGVRHGTGAGALGLGVRAVVWERAAGQGVQVALALVVLAVAPSPLQPAVRAVLWVAVPLVALAGAAVVATALAAGRLRRGTPRPPRGTARPWRAVRGAAAEARRAVLRPGTWPVVLLSSAGVVAGLVGTFLLAARAAGVQDPPHELVPLALVVLLAAAIPLNVAGWGPREGAAVWVFAAAGQGAGTGAAVAAAFGVLTVVATLPGAAVLLAARLRPPRGAGVLR